MTHNASSVIVPSMNGTREINMKKLVIVLALAFASSSAFAQDGGAASGAGGAAGVSTAVAVNTFVILLGVGVLAAASSSETTVTHQ